MPTAGAGAPFSRGRTSRPGETQKAFSQTNGRPLASAWKWTRSMSCSGERARARRWKRCFMGGCSLGGGGTSVGEECSLYASCLLLPYRVVRVAPQPQPSASNRAYAYVKERLLDGRFAGGTLLSENDLAHRLGISRTPVRQAFVQLEAEQLLELYPRR